MFHIIVSYIPYSYNIGYPFGQVLEVGSLTNATFETLLYTDTFSLMHPSSS